MTDQSVTAGEEQRGRIPFRLRIGVTGHRNLPDSDELRKAINDAIDLAIAESGHSAAATPNTPVTLTVVSALAEGADRMVARAVLDRPGSKLISVLPVCKNDIDVYLSDFADDESRAEFHRYHDHAWRRISPPRGAIPEGTGKEAREAGYLWASLATVRNCDVLIALWDGEAARGTGGTADVIGRLRKRDERISDAEPSEAAAGVFGTAAALILSMDTPLVLDTAGPLRIIIPTKGDPTPRVDDAPPFNVAGDVIRKRIASDLGNLDRLNGIKFRPGKWSRAQNETRKYLAPDEYRQYPRLHGIFERITPPLIRADQAAIAANRLFLTLSYLLFCCTAAATIIAAFEAVVFPGTWGLTIGEIVFLAASLFIVFAERRWKTHERWTAYRFLTERLRSACYLLAAGATPGTEFETRDTPAEPGQHGWIQRAFTEILAEQGAGKQEDGAGPEGTEPLEILNSLIRVYWVSGQIDYFKSKSDRLMRQHNIVRSLLSAVLFITIAAAIVHSLHIWPLESNPTEALVMCAIGLPAVAAVLANIRSLREFSRHSTRFANMAKVLHWYLDQFVAESSVDHLRDLALSVYDVLTAESRGWLGAVSGRGIEIG
jgi:hypothetical protein